MISAPASKARSVARRACLAAALKRHGVEVLPAETDEYGAGVRRILPRAATAELAIIARVTC
jgi:hypothetical protein